MEERLQVRDLVKISKSKVFEHFYGQHCHHPSFIKLLPPRLEHDRLDRVHDVCITRVVPFVFTDVQGGLQLNNFLSLAKFMLSAPTNLSSTSFNLAAIYHLLLAQYSSPLSCSCPLLGVLHGYILLPCHGLDNFF